MSPDRPNAIEIQGLTVSFGSDCERVSVLNGMGLSVEEGELAVLLGPSGCGKTTLLRCVAGLDSWDQGEIFVFGKAVSGPSVERGMVFQDYSSFPWLSVKRNVEFGLRLQSRNEARIKEVSKRLISAVGLEGFKDAYPHQLSGGMKQRVALARTLAVDPEVLLLDEPFGSLDSRTRAEMQSLLLRLWDERQKSVLFVTHDIEEAIFLADRIFLASEKPTNIRRSFEVPFERPRSDNIRTSSRFNGLKQQIMDLY